MKVNFKDCAKISDCGPGWQEKFSQIKCCCVCGSPEVAICGIWEPAPKWAEQLHQPPGKKRFIVYGLCERCAQIEDIEDRVEVIALASHSPIRFG